MEFAGGFFIPQLIPSIAYFGNFIYLKAIQRCFGSTFFFKMRLS